MNISQKSSGTAQRIARQVDDGWHRSSFVGSLANAQSVDHKRHTAGPLLENGSSVINRLILSSGHSLSPLAMPFVVDWHRATDGFQYRDVHDRSALTLLLSTRRCAAAPREDWKVQSVPTGRGQSMSSFVCSPPVGLSAERRWCFAGSRTRSDGYRKPPRISQVWRCQTHLRGLTPLIAQTLSKRASD